MTDLPTLDAELQSQLNAAPDSQARGVALGVDFEVLAKTRKRALVGSLIVAVVGVVPLVLWSFQTSGGFFAEVPALLASAGIGVVGFFIFFVASATIVARVFKAGPFMVQQVAGSAIIELAAGFGLLAAVLVTSSLQLPIAGVLVAAAVSAQAASTSATLLPQLIRSNHRQLIEVFRQYEQLPKWATVLGGKVRWIVTCVFLTAIAYLCAVALFARTPIWAWIVLPILAGAAALSAWLSFRAGPWAWAGALAAGAAALLVLAILFG